MQQRFKGKVAIVTGAAQGIGAASARILAEGGAMVVVADLNEAGAKDCASAIRAAGGQAQGVYVDAMQEASVRSLIQETFKAHGPIGILHNNAGGTWVDRDVQAADLTAETWDKVLAWNLYSVHWGIQEVLPIMLEAGGGAIVNTVTVGSNFAQSTEIAYGVAKAGVGSYTRYVAVQYGPRGIRCNGVSPGLILTPHASSAMSSDFKTGIIQHVTTPRAGRPDDIGHAVAFLASDEAGYINGQILNVDGGVSIRFPHDAAVLGMGGYGPGHPIPPLASTS